jgi:DNA-binding SARP family transcriptional activator
LVDTVSIYRNHFLTGFSLKDSHPFNDWVYAESEELKRKFAEALTLLTESYCMLDQAKSAIPHGRRLVSLDR